MKEKLTEPEKAYFAGIIDGEGSISGGFTQQSLIVSVIMSTDTVTKELYRAFGGLHYKTKAKSTTRGYFYCWRTNGVACKLVLETIRPYTRLKKVHLELGLRFIETIRDRRDLQRPLSARELVTKQKLIEALRYLNKPSVTTAQ